MNLQGLLLDVEGVLVADKRYHPVEGAVEFIHRVRRQGLPLRLISNNTTDAIPTLAEKLRKAGFDFQHHEIRTCTATAVNHLRRPDVQRCLVLGTDALRQIFTDAGFEVVDESQVDAIVVGLDTDLHYERLCLACQAVVQSNASLIALHRNRVYTDAHGRTAPSVGPIVCAIEYATQTQAQVMGKPNAEIYQQALQEIGAAPETVVMVSDDPFSDLAGAKRLGIRTAFVLSGKYADRSVLGALSPEEMPDMTIDRIGSFTDTQWLSM